MAIGGGSLPEHVTSMMMIIDQAAATPKAYTQRNPQFLRNTIFRLLQFLTILAVFYSYICNEQI